MTKKIIFMGTPFFAVPILKSLYQNGYLISTVYTQPPKKKARGQKLVESPINAEANKLSLQVRCPKNLDSKEEYNFFKKLQVGKFGVIIL